MAESEITEEMVEQPSDIKPETTDVIKQEICSFCADTKKCKTELLDPDCEGNFLKKEFCDHHINLAYSDAKENQSDKNIVCETTADTNVSPFVTSTNQQNLVPKISEDHRCAECNFRCKKRQYLANHMKYVHSDERPFSCSICQYSCKTKGDLSNHMK